MSERWRIHECLQVNPELGKVAGTTGETLQSYPLALTQLLITYHMLKAIQIHP